MQREKEGSPKDFFLSFSVASSFLGFFFRSNTGKLKR